MQVDVDLGPDAYVVDPSPEGDVLYLGLDVDVVGAVDTLQLPGVEDGDDVSLARLHGLQPQGGQERALARHIAGEGTRRTIM